MKTVITSALATVLSMAATSVAAADISFSGFGTAGLARSDQPYNYERFLNERGTFKRDSVLGVQMDAKLSEQVSFTLQGKVAPSIKNDTRIDATVTWAFLSWRPSNDLLFRAGRFRIPLYLNTENTDVGATFDYARLPTEIYSNSPTTDFDGIFLSKTWSLEAGELTLDGYWGSTQTYIRGHIRDNMSPQSSGASFTSLKVRAQSLVLTYQIDDNTFRAGLHDAYAKRVDGQSLSVTYPLVSMLPGVGYYQVSNQIPGPGVPTVDEIHTPIFTIGADIAVGHGVRLMGEYLRRNIVNITNGADTQGAYLAARKPIGAWTPYVSVARLLSSSRARNLYNQLSGNTIPGFLPGAAQINASQRAGADSIAIYDQTTLALGTSYRLTPTSKIKAEWARTKIGDGSALVDAPAGGDSRGKVINVLSLSYSFVF